MAIGVQRSMSGVLLAVAALVLAFPSASSLPSDLTVVDCAKEQWPFWEGCRFRCPDNSCVKSTSKCVDSFDDCYCLPWFKKTLWGTCDYDMTKQCLREQPLTQPEWKGCNYKCPEHSCLMEGVDCLKGSHQCECEHGYKKAEFTGHCVPMSLSEINMQNVCPRKQNNPGKGCDYVCPEYSCIKPTSKCVSGIKDCMCVEGYAMSKFNQCIRLENAM